MPVIDLDRFGAPPRGGVAWTAPWVDLKSIIARGIRFRGAGKSLDALSRAIIEVLADDPGQTAVVVLERLASDRDDIVQDFDLVEGKVWYRTGGRDRDPITFRSFENRVTKCRKILRGEITLSDKP